MEQLAEWSFPIPEVRSSKPVIGKILNTEKIYYKLLKRRKHIKMKGRILL